MEQFIFPGSEHRLARLERLLSGSGRNRNVGRELRHYLLALHKRIAPQLGHSRMDREMHDGLHRLMAKADSARTGQDARDLIREIRQYQLALSSLTSTRDVETRLLELEAQVSTSAEGTTTAETVPEVEAVTLDSLKGKRILFAIMPFAQEFGDVWTGGIKRAASGTGLTPIRIDMLTQSSEITDDIVKTIHLAEVVVVDVTGNNPNVMFEFGFALALKKKQVIISQATEYLTFDIKNLRTLIYGNTWQGIETLHKDLQPFIKGALGKAARQTKKK